jgi:hypothetical protein
VRSWYRQNLRWMCGTFQGIRGHNGRRATLFDLTYVGLWIDWVLPTLVTPIILALLGIGHRDDPVCASGACRCSGRRCSSSTGPGRFKPRPRCGRRRPISRPRPVAGNLPSATPSLPNHHRSTLHQHKETPCPPPSSGLPGAPETRSCPPPAADPEASSSPSSAGSLDDVVPGNRSQQPGPNSEMVVPIRQGAESADRSAKPYNGMAPRREPHRWTCAGSAYSATELAVTA